MNQAREAIQEKLTKAIYLRMLNRRYLRTEDVVLRNGSKVKVFVFSSQDHITLGQHTIFGTIIIHEDVFIYEAKDFLILHEFGHAKQWFGYPGFLAILLIVLDIKIEHWEAFVMFLLLTIGFSWLLEINAEFYVISQFGLADYHDEYNRIKKIARKYSFGERFPSYLSGPPLGWILKLYEFKHKFS